MQGLSKLRGIDPGSGQAPRRSTRPPPMITRGGAASQVIAAPSQMPRGVALPTPAQQREQRQGRRNAMSWLGFMAGPALCHRTRG